MIEFHDDKSIGRVLFIVEGSRTEFVILRKIFCDILKYEYVEKRRNQPDTFVSRNNSHSKVAVINTEESNITDITDSEAYLDRLFEMLNDQYDFPVDQSAIYYLFDRDPKSNTNKDKILNYIDTLRDPYDNGITKAGMLLLSYPSVEAYIVSEFVTDTYAIRKNLGSEVKAFIGENTYIQTNKMSKETIIHATEEFIAYLENEKYDWDMDEFADISRSIFENQEQDYMVGKGYQLFSMLTLAFLQLGIITYYESASIAADS